MSNGRGFRVGDSVVHPFHGVGEVIAIEQKLLGGERNTYYVVSLGNQTIWVPIKKASGIGLRPVISKRKLGDVIKILRSKADPLADDLRARQQQIAARLTDRSLKSLSEVLRDLNGRGASNKLNESDLNTVRRVKVLLVGEWAVACNITREEAQRQLDAVLKGT